MNVHETEHKGLLINETGIVQEAYSKQGIGSMIVKNVEKKWRTTMKTILLGVSGSISAYKAADITSQLAKLGYNVEILMTKSSTAFITPLTLQSLSKNPVHTDVMMEIDPSKINHIELAKKRIYFSSTCFGQYNWEISPWDCRRLIINSCFGTLS